MPGYRKLGRTSAHRKAMLRNLVTDLFCKLTFCGLVVTDMELFKLFLAIHNIKY